MECSSSNVSTSNPTGATVARLGIGNWCLLTLLVAAAAADQTFHSLAVVGVRARVDGVAKVIEVVRYDASGAGTPVVSLDSALGWYHSAAATHTADGTYYTSLAESETSSSVYAVSVATNTIKARLKAQPPFKSLHVLLKDKLRPDLLIGVAACNETTSGDCIFAAPLDLLQPFALLAQMPSGWLAVDTGAALKTERGGGVLYVLSANMFNASIDYASLFGFELTGTTARLVSHPTREYGGPIITFGLLGSDNRQHIRAISQDNNKSAPAYYMVDLDAAAWSRVADSKVVLYANDRLPEGFDAYPSVVGGSVESAAIAFYITKVPQHVGGHQSRAWEHLPNSAVESLASTVPVDLVLVHSDNSTSLLSGWNETAVNLVVLNV